MCLLYLGTERGTGCKMSRRSERKLPFIWPAKMKWELEGREHNLLVCNGFLSAGEIAVIRAAFDKTGFETSSMEGEIDPEQRKSDSADVSLGNNAKLFFIVLKIMQKLGFGIDQCEPQFCRYSKGGKFLLHHDSVAYNVETGELDETEDGNLRIVTVIVYLNDCDGGATHFPRLGGEGFAVSDREVLFGPGECGVRVEPKTGTMVVFKNVTKDGIPDPYSVHEGEEVKSDHKHILQIWVHHKQWTGGMEASSDDDDARDETSSSGGQPSKRKRQKTGKEKADGKK